MYYKFYNTLDKSLTASLREIDRVLAKDANNPELERLRANMENSVVILNTIKAENKTNSELIKEIEEQGFFDQNCLPHEINENNMTFATDLHSRRNFETDSLLYKVIKNLFHDYEKKQNISLKVKGISRYSREDYLSVKVSLPKQIDKASFLTKYENLLIMIEEVRNKLPDIRYFINDILILKNKLHKISRDIDHEQRGYKDRQYLLQKSLKCNDGLKYLNDKEMTFKGLNIKREAQNLNITNGDFQYNSDIVRQPSIDGILSLLKEKSKS